MDLPIIGQPFDVVLAYSTAIIQCKCPAQPTFALHGKGKPTVCPACGNVYAISDSGTLQIGQVTGYQPRKGS